MFNQPEKIKVTKVGYRYGLDDEYGDAFTDGNNNIRTWKSENGAIAYVKNSGYPWHVTRLNGKIAYINCLDPVAEAERQSWGPHEWYKLNAVTILDGTRAYDEARCKHCGMIEKRYGLDRWLTSGHCPKNPNTRPHCS